MTLLWFPWYCFDRFAPREKPDTRKPVDIFLCIADHFEPGYAEAPLDVQRKRVGKWAEEFPALARRHRDAGGPPPKHTWFSI